MYIMRKRCKHLFYIQQNISVIYFPQSLWCCTVKAVTRDYKRSWTGEIVQGFGNLKCGPNSQKYLDFTKSETLRGDFQKSYVFETMHVMSAGFGEMFEGDSADTCAAHVDGGLNRGSRVCGPRSKDPHWRERKLVDS